MRLEAFRSAVQLQRLPCELASFFLGIIDSRHYYLTNCQHMQVISEIQAYASIGLLALHVGQSNRGAWKKRKRLCHSFVSIFAKARTRLTGRKSAVSPRLRSRVAVSVSRPV